MKTPEEWAKTLCRCAPHWRGVDGSGHAPECAMDEAEDIIAEAVAAERERAALVADAFVDRYAHRRGDHDRGFSAGAQSAAAAIRRGPG